MHRRIYLLKRGLCNVAVRTTYLGEQDPVRNLTPAYGTLQPNLLPAMDILRIVLSVLLPPLGVFLQVGIGFHFWLNILLTLLGYIPGLIHAIWIIAKR